MVAFHFDRSHFASVYRVAGAFVLLKSAGYLILGYSHNLTGSYDTAFIIFVLVLLGCFVLTLRLNTESGKGLEAIG